MGKKSTKWGQVPSSYKQAGVDAPLMDLCSEIAYQFAKQTFRSRAKSPMGRPVSLEGGFTGAIDMGPYYLVQNDDTVGTKMLVAEALKKYDTIGYDLAAMVADDAVCVGAEVISISNTIMTSNLKKEIVADLMRGFAKACKWQKIIIPGGEIAILKDVMRGYEWGATALGVVEKKKFIDGHAIREGDFIVGLKSPNFRSNGITLVRHILKKNFGNRWYQKKPSWASGKTWGEIVLEPSVIYHDAILKLHGRFGEKPKVRVKGIAHVTGGGLPGNTPRIFAKSPSGKTFGVLLDGLYDPPKAMLELQRLGNVSDREAYETWNMGVGMILVTDEPEKAIRLLHQSGVHAKVVGKIVKKPGVTVVNHGAKHPGEILVWKMER